MTRAHDHARFEKLMLRLDPGCTLLRSWPLTGGVSAQVTAVEIIRPHSRPERLVVRRHGTADRAANPHIALHEFTLLQRLHSAGLPVPKPIYLDASREIFPDPILMLEYIEGASGFPTTPDIDPLDAFTTHLARIHAQDWTTLDLSFLPQRSTRVAQKLHALKTPTGEPTAEERQIRDALYTLPSMPQSHHPAVLLHGDYWWGNTLWQNGELIAVIDWENAAIGDPLSDLANSRLEILWTLGQNGMEQFTQRYHSLAPQIDLANLPYWDLLTALRPARNMAHWGLASQTEQTMRTGLQEFIALASRQVR